MSNGTLDLTIVDSDTGQLTAARVELVDHEGNCFVPEDALPTGGDVVIGNGTQGKDDGLAVGS